MAVLLRKKIFWLFYFMLASFLSEGQESLLAIDRIDPSLIKNSNAVIRKDETKLTVKGIGECFLEREFVVTILNPNSSYLSKLELPHNKNKKAEILEASLYDSKGVELQKLKSKNIEDVVEFEEGMYADNRLRIAKFSNSNYPYTVKFKYTIHYFGLLFYPEWCPQPTPDISVESANLTMIISDDQEFKYIEKNLEYKGEISTSSNAKTYRWGVGPLTVFVREPYGLSFDEKALRVIAAPVNTKIGEIEGSMGSWKEFGSLIHTLTDGKDELPQNAVDTITAITLPLKEKEEQVKAIFDYVKSTIKLVNLHQDVIGWEPKSGLEVYKNGCADPKSMVYFTKRLLNVVGIDSYYTLVYGGGKKGNLEKNFPIEKPSHMILTVPMDKDTVWLDCANKSMPYNFLGELTGNKYALIVNKDDSKLIMTQTFPQDKNRVISTTRMKISSNGILDLHIKSKNLGIEINHNNLLEAITDGNTQRKRWIYKNLNLPNFTLNTYSLNYDSNAPERFVNKEIKVTIGQYATMNSELIVLKICPYKQWFNVPDKLVKREKEIILDGGSTRIDTLELEIPEGYNVAQYPNAQKLSSKFGNFSFTYEIDNENNLLKCVQSISLIGGEFQPGEYNEMRRFYTTLSKALKGEVVLSKS